MLNLWVRRSVLPGAALLVVFAFPGRPTKSADKNVNLDGVTGNESIVSTNVVTTYPVKIKNKVTNKAVGRAFRFSWPSAGPGGFSSEAGNATRPGTAAGVGAVWTWETTQQVFSFTGTRACPNTNDICFTQTVPPGSTAPLGPFGVPGRSLSASNVTVTNESLTSSLLSFFSPETELFHVTSSVEQLASGLFRYETNVTNLTGGTIDVHQPPSPLGCNSVCGNGFREGSEECDGSNLGGQSCDNIGQAGPLFCDPTCHLDYSKCFPASCGNNDREGYEQCDGSDLAGYDCVAFGAGGGELGCDSKCNFDFSGCTGYCGNNTIEGKETCDGTDLDGWTCSNLPGGGGNFSPLDPPSGTLSCRSDCRLDLTKCQNVCGNGLTEPNADTPEECDGDDLSGRTCEDLTKGTRHGQLSCGLDCFYDTSGCTCGNNVRDGFDECDGTDFGGADCGSFTPGGSGTLNCTELCRVDLQECNNVCGNGIKDGSDECDGSDFGSEDCVSQGGTGPSNKGGLICNSDCTISPGFCLGFCGNGVIDDGEECDGLNIGGASCDTKLTTLLGGPSGPGPQPTCNSSCQLDFSECNVPCELDSSDTTGIGNGETRRTRCEVSSHPAKEVTGQIAVCGTEIPSGQPCGGSSGESEGTHNVFVPDESITIGDFYFTPVSVEVVDGGNGLAQPGETVDLRIKIVNSGSVDAHGVVGTLSFPPQDLDGDGTAGSPHETITVVNDTSSYPDSCMTGFPAGSANCDSPAVPVAGCANTPPLFRISIPPDFPIDVAPRFTLTVTHAPPVLAPDVSADGPAGEGNVTRPANQAMGVVRFQVGVIVGIVGPFCGDHILNPATEQCDDGNQLDGDCCSSTCQFESTGSPCSDGQACTVNDTCSAQHVCTGAPKPCDEGNPCTADSCTPGTGVCTHSNLPDGTACTFNLTNERQDALDICALSAPPASGVCQAGQCVPGSNQCPVGFVEADAMVKQSRQTTNFGTKPELEADKPSPANQSFLKFRLAGTQGQPIGHVRLRLFALKTATSGGRIHKTSCNWTETGVTWNSRPSLGSSFVNIGPVVQGQRYDVDITSLLDRTGDGTYCVGIDNVQTDADYNSREAAAGRPAILLESVCPCTPVTSVVQADATVVSTSANANFGNDTTIGIDASPVKQTFVRVNVSGLGSYTVTSARLRLQVANLSGADSDKGGQIRLVPSTRCGWIESGPGSITYNTRPPSAGSVLSTVGSVVQKQLVEFDLKTTITANGTYCYRLESTSSNNADYNSLQGPAPKPELVLVVKP